ncbi:MAG: hypothetical protein F6K41_36210 [Symploca sp. SIO3E6]|nr:hypothetical protein [Caldora sp. SIO3E6]
MSEKKGGEQRSGGAEEQRSRGAEEEEGTDNFWIQSSRNPTHSFVHPATKEWGFQRFSETVA